MNNPQQPREYDAVLGGNSPSLEGAAVLGGIEGVKLRLQIPDSTVKIAAIKQALNYGEQGLDLVIAGLKDESWDIQNAAYLILNKRTETRIKQILTGKTDKNGFSDRFIQSVNKIPSKYVIYLQEDMWLKRALDKNLLNDLIKFMDETNADSVRIHSKLWYYNSYKLEPTNYFIQV
jgi:hypothetical protein